MCIYTTHIQAHEEKIIALIAIVSSRCIDFSPPRLYPSKGHKYGVSILISKHLHGTCVPHRPET